MKKLMTGNEAIARGVYEAGVHFASGYPGTPSTEILENLGTYPKEEITAEWAVNEKVAMEACFGASLAGGRAFCAMKHVGLNVAADPLMTITYVGVNGGLVFVSADEPGQHSSQNEQDNRNYAMFAKIPMFEPSNSQECLDMVKAAFGISEEYDTPVMIRMTTRICHTKCIVTCGTRSNVQIRPYVKDVVKCVPVPAHSRELRKKIEERLHNLKDYSNNCIWNFFEWNDNNIGVIASGACYYFAKEVFSDTASYLKIGYSNPLPNKMIQKFAESVKKLYIIEENDSYIETVVRALGYNCYGKNLFPAYGEMTPEVIRESVFGSNLCSIKIEKEKVIKRPPAFCAGCPHRGLFYEIGRLKGVSVAGDIGCYSLAFDIPYCATDFTLDMGSSPSAAHGMQNIMNRKTEGGTRIISVVGDSTFFHSGINGLMNLVYNKSNAICIILDNRITGMTGHQDNPGTGYTLQGDLTEILDIAKLVEGCGVKNIVTVDPNNLEQVRKELNAAMARENELSVIITRWPCALKKLSPQDKKEFAEAFTGKYQVSVDKCIGCKMCIKAGCPALSFNAVKKKAVIDKKNCVGCGVCSQICRKGAIEKVVS